MGHTYMMSHTLDGPVHCLLISTDGTVTFFVNFHLDGIVTTLKTVYKTRSLLHKILLNKQLSRSSVVATSSDKKRLIR